MKNRIWVIWALVLSLILGGCGLTEAGGDFLGTAVVIPYEDMVYERPDPEELEEILAQACRTARESTSLEETEQAIYDYYDAYDRIYTALALADIEFSKNMTDIYWSEEYDYCLALSPRADSGLEELYMALAQSPMRAELEGEDYFGPGYFDEYETDAVMDEGYLAIAEKETELLSRYYDLAEQYAGEELTVERVGELYEEICLSFGFDSREEWDSRSFITVSHFFTTPMYMISYVVSNDLAVQIYQAELENPGAGLEIYTEALWSQDSYIISFAETLGLTSPFDPSRMNSLKELFASSAP